MKSAHVLFVIMICILFYSCESLIEILFGKNEELTFIKTDYVGDQLKIDGYYYHWYGKPYNDKSLMEILFLYRNGVVLWGGTQHFEELNIRESEFISGKYHQEITKNPMFWGILAIDSTTIQYEMLHGGPFRAMIDSGIIINDSTFVILKRKSSYGTYGIKEKDLQDTFRLKPFSPKPDSTNIYIK